MQEFFTRTERIIILNRAAGLSIEQIADKLGLNFDPVNNSNKEIHRKLKSIYNNGAVTGMQVLGIAVALGAITALDLKFIYATQHIDLNKLT